MLTTNLLAISLSISLTTPPESIDPFAGDSSVPSPEGPEWEAPPEPPPPAPPPPPPVVSSYDDARPEVEEPDEENPHKPVLFAGIIIGALGAGSAGLAYYFSEERKKSESQLTITEQSNDALVASGLQPSDTSDLESKIRNMRGATIGFGVGAATLLLTGGILLLVGATRTRNHRKNVTWAPRGAGIEVSF